MSLGGGGEGGCKGGREGGSEVCQGEGMEEGDLWYVTLQ